jgi:predicted nucleic-acid-binding Zn-ribbon protein
LTYRGFFIEAATTPSMDAADAPDADRGCPKCGHVETDVGTISTTGGGLSKLFDIQTNRFKVVSCTHCGYSELYRDDTSGASDIVDVFLG